MRYGKMPAPRGGQRHKKGRSFTAPSRLLYDNQYIIVPSKKSMPSVPATPAGVTWKASGSRGAPPSAAKQPAATRAGNAGGCAVGGVRQPGSCPFSGKATGRHLFRQASGSRGATSPAAKLPAATHYGCRADPTGVPWEVSGSRGATPSAAKPPATTRYGCRPLPTSGGSSCVLWSGGWRKRGGRLPHGRRNPGSPPRCAGFAQCCLPLCRQ